MKVGSGKFVFEEAEGWAQLPKGWNLGEVPGVAVDSQDRLFAFCRSEHPVVIFDRNGRFLESWGDGMFVCPHMIFIGPDDSVYCVDAQGHRVKKFTPDGKLLMTLAPRMAWLIRVSCQMSGRQLSAPGPFQYSDRRCPVS